MDRCSSGKAVPYEPSIVGEDTHHIGTFLDRSAKFVWKHRFKADRSTDLYSLGIRSIFNPKRRLLVWRSQPITGKFRLIFNVKHG